MLPDKENQHLPQKQNYFECQMCGQCFSTFSDIESHMKLKHQKKPAQIAAKSITARKEETTN